jgi:hypothetical protein
LSGVFPIQSSLKQGDALLPLLFNFALEYTIRKFLENQAELELNGIHQLQVYGDDVNLLGKNINTTKKITKALLDANKKVGLEISAEKTKYICSCVITKLQDEIIT